MSFSDNYCVQMARTTRELIKDYLSDNRLYEFTTFNSMFSLTGGMGAVIKSIPEVLHELGKCNLVDEDELKYQLLDVAYSNLKPLDLEVINVAFSRSVSQLQQILPHPRVTGKILNLEGYAEKVIFNQANAFEAFIRELDTLLTWSAKEGPGFIEERRKRLPNYASPTKEAELETVLVELAEARESLWIYGEFN